MSKTFSSLGRRFALGRMFVSVLVLALCVNSLDAGQPKVKKHENRRQIDQMELAWRDALLKSDTNSMSNLLADDYMAITANGTLQTKDQTLANLRAGKVHITALDFSDRKVRFYGKTALVTSLAEMKGSTADGDVSGSFRYTRVYVRDQQGAWKIVSFEASRIRHPGAGK